MVTDATVSRFSTFWLTTGIALTTATRFRMSVVPIGVGEILIALWLLGRVLAFAAGRQHFSSPAARGFITFWAGGFVLMLAGWLYSVSLGVSAPGRLHDLFAYTFAALFTIVLTTMPNANQQIRAAGPALLAVLVMPLFTMFILWNFGFRTSAWSDRFTGWSLNPNQVALGMVSAPFIAFYFRRRSRGRRARLWYTFIIVASVTVGIASLSDGMFVGWAAGAATLVIASAVRAFRRRTRSFVRAIAIRLVLPTLLLWLIVFGGHAAWSRLYSVGEEMYYGEGNQGGGRVALVLSGIEVIAQSPLVGWGPGAHTTLGRDGIHESEAHNGLVDWGTATGIPGALLFVWLHGWIAHKARTQPALLAAVIALFVLGMTHHDLRHPLYWFYLLFVLAASEEEKSPRYASSVSCDRGGAALALRSGHGLRPASARVSTSEQTFLQRRPEGRTALHGPTKV